MAITNNVFYRDALTPDEQYAIKRGPLWPLISGFHYKTNALYLSKVLRNDAEAVDVLMCVADGWPVLRLAKTTAAAAYRVYVLDTYDGLFRTVAETANVSYILKRINDKKQTKKRGSKHPLGHTLHANIDRHMRASPQPTAHYLMEQLVTMFARSLRDSLPSKESVKLTGDAQWESVRIAMGDTTTESVSDAVRAELQRAWGAIQRRNRMLAATSEKITDMFDANASKWMLAYRAEYGYIAMKFRPTKLAAWCTNYAFPDVPRCPDIMPSDIDVVEPPAYYPTLQALPPAYAAEMLPRLNFAKANRTAPGTGISVDPSGFICATDLLQERIGCITLARSGYTVMIFDA